MFGFGFCSGASGSGTQDEAVMATMEARAREEHRQAQRLMRKEERFFRQQRENEERKRRALEPGAENVAGDFPEHQVFLDAEVAYGIKAGFESEPVLLMYEKFMNDPRDNRAMVVSLTPRTESEPFNAKEICKASLERTGGQAVALLLCGKGVVRYEADAPAEEFELPISKKRVVVGPDGEMIEVKRTLSKDLSEALDDVPVDVPVILIGFSRLWRFLKERPLKRVLTHILYGPKRIVADDTVGLLSNEVEVMCLEEPAGDDAH